MLTITGTLFCGLAVIAVALEATGVAIVLGGIAAWMITHSTRTAHDFSTGPLWFTGPYFDRQWPTDFKIVD
jgi:hypothetical protein